MRPFSVFRRRGGGSRAFRRLGGYAFALAAFGAALEARFLLAPILPPAGFPFLSFFPAVLLTAFVAGLGPSLLASALSVAAATYFFVPPVNSIALAGAPEAVAVGFFAAILVVDCVVIHVMTTAQRALRAEQTRAGEAAAAQGHLAAELSRVLEATSDGVLALGSDWRVSFMNGHARRLIASGRDLTGQVLWDAYPEAVGSAFWHAFRRCMAERVPTVAEEHYPPLGRAFATRAFPAEGGGITVFFRDVTEERAAAARLAANTEAERRARAALAESETRLRLALQAGRMGVWSWDLAADRLEWDARQFELFGLDPAASQPSGEAALARVHPADLPGLKAAIEAAIAAGDGTFDHEFRLVLPDGATRWIGGYGRAVPGPDGRAARMAGLNFDITARRGAEAALARANAEAREAAERVQLALAAGAIVGTWDWELPTDRFTVDERFAFFFGIDPALGRTGLSLEQVIATVHPDDLAGLRTAIAEAISRGGPYAHQYRVRGRDGVYRWIEANGRVDHAADGTPARFPGVLLDIQARRQAEAARAASELRFRAVFEGAGVGMARVAFESERFMEVNDAFCRMLGRTREEMLTVPWPAMTHPEDVDLDLVPFRRMAKGELDAYTVEKRFLHPGGGHVWTRLTLSLVRDADGQPDYEIAVIEDITDRKRAEAVLARDKAELERLAEERGRALADTEARLAQASKMEALGRLAGGIAHDFNNVLQAVQGGIALAAKRVRRDADEAVRFLDLAADATRRGATVTGRLLAFARRGELSAGSVEAGPLLEGLAQILRHTLGPAVDLRVEAHPLAGALLADAGQLEAVLVNLANNARDALPGGVGSVILRTEPAVVDGHSSDVPETLAEGEYIRLTVADDGMGMAPEVLARVTEPFFTTKGPGKGTGLGLSMARGFAEQSGGAFSIESALGHGTTVSLWLPRPLAGSAAARHEAAAPPIPAEGLPAAILLVDDERGVRETVAAALADLRHAVTQAEDGAAALARLEEGAPVDVLVTDLAMPGGMDGLALIREARQRRPRLPAVLITGHAGEAGRAALREAAGTGPFALVRKPASADVLETQIVTLLVAARDAAE